MYSNLKSYYFTRKYTVGKGRIIFTAPFIRLHIIKDKSARIQLDGDLILIPHIDTKGCVRINLASNSILRINNNFTVGDGVGLFLDINATLEIEGQHNESASGITCNTQIMCYQSIKIGADFLCSWNVYITDSDWHILYKNGNKMPYNADVSIGNHCWIGSNVIIGKGTIIGDNCIIPAFSKISHKTIQSGSVYGGLSPREIARDLTWNR